MNKDKIIISFVGAGGKTSSIVYTARELRRKGKKILIATTTHLEYSSKCNISGDADQIIEELMRNGLVIAGEKVSEEKMGPLSKEVLYKVMEKADVVLIEADGSKKYPFKAPESYEPVILPESSHIFVVAGMSAFGKTIQESCHRMEAVCKLLDAKPTDVLTAENMAKVIKNGYVEPLHKEYPAARIKIILNQADELNRISAAEKIKYYFDKENCHVCSLRKALWDV